MFVNDFWLSVSLEFYWMKTMFFIFYWIRSYNLDEPNKFIIKLDLQFVLVRGICFDVKLANN